MGLSLTTRKKLKELTAKLPPSVVYSKTRTRRKRKKQFGLMKLKRGCDKCGYNKCSLALHFHHRDPNTKLAAVSQLLDHNRGDIDAEIAKCDLLCANCHAEQRAQRKD